ncbi:riboflavin kinase [Agromyces sp. NPDC055661]
MVADGDDARSAAAPGPRRRAPDLVGRIVSGHGRGRSLGFPTANIAEDGVGREVADGVYSCWIRLLPDTTVYGATISIGDNPTFDDVVDRRVEAFVHDLEADLYGRRVDVWIVRRLRSMTRYGSLAELIEQTARDVAHSRGVLAGEVPLDR